MVDPLSREQRTLEHARRLAEAGYRVFPCKPFSKVPATPHGCLDATNDLAQVNAWFDNDRGFNLAVATGQQPNGVFLFVIDVDPKNGGMETWEALTAKFGLPLAPRHETPSGGFHLFFNAPGLRNSAGRLGQGIDTRGEGGYVVVPPSRLHDDEGEVITYRASASSGLVLNQPTLLPDWLVPQAPVPVTPPSFVMTEYGPADRIREGWVWQDELPPDGWVQHSVSGGDIRWTRPGKSPRDGHSATLHASGAFVVFTQERPFGGKPTNGADGATFSPYEYVLHYRFGGDKRAVAREYGEGLRLRATAPDPRLGAGRAGDWDEAYLSSDFWASSAWLEQVRDGAWSLGRSPEALLMAFLSWYAVLVPPSLQIPAILSDEGSFDLLTVIVGGTGDGKSSMIRRAAKLFPAPEMRRDVLTGMGLGSGEGLIDAFFGMVAPDPEKPKVKEKRQVYTGVHFSIDEGKILAELSGRAGTIHIPTMCSAWSGSTLSTTNASEERKRHLKAGRYRFTATMGIQPEFAHDLMDDNSTAVGFAGRLVFGMATSPVPDPDHRPEWPGALDISVPPSFTTPTLLSYPASVISEVRWDDHNRRQPGVVRDPADAHSDLLRLKLAGLLALIEGQMDVSSTNWSAATAIIDASRSARQMLKSYHAAMERDRRHRQYAIAVERETAVASGVEKELLGEAMDRILLVLTEPMAPSMLTSKMTKRQRPFRDEALRLLDITGKVVKDGERWRKP